MFKTHTIISVSLGLILNAIGEWINNNLTSSHRIISITITEDDQHTYATITLKEID